MTGVKICGIKTHDSLQAAISAGADYVGFVFYPSSPRFIHTDTAKTLCALLTPATKGVGVFVDPHDSDLEQVLSVVPLDMIQLHGSETPARVKDIRARWNRPVMKAIPVKDKNDPDTAAEFEEIADWLLFDAKPPEGSNLPGGTGTGFDWSILEGRRFRLPWMLSGGLNVQNVRDAIMRLDPTCVDVSSGVESEPGQKDATKISEFINEAKSIF